MRMLIVEDEVMIREGLAGLIKSHTGHTVTGEMSNGQEDPSLALRLKSDLVITGICMLATDGLQMIEALHDMSLPIRAVILSGYSELDHTKKAIHLGADDYLLKPLAVENVVDLLERAQKKAEAEEQRNVGIPGQCTKELIYGGPLSEERDRWMRTICGSGAFVHSQLYLGYTGDTSIGYEEETGGKFDQVRALLPSVRPYISWDRGGCQFLGLAAPPEDEGVSHLPYQVVEQKIVRPYKRRDDRTVRAMVSMKGRGSVQKGARDTELPIKETLPVMEGDLATRERTDAVDWKEFRFPVGLGVDVGNVLCRGDPENARRMGGVLMESTKDGPYREQEIRQAYLKVTYLLLDTVREIDGDTYGQLQNVDLLTRRTEAVTLRGLEQNYGDGPSFVCSPCRVKEGISNCTIKRAINYIREHYQEGVSPEEVAGRLGTTPEYLSMLFSRETGENFSTFLRKSRISHAERLLKGTDMKVYEITEIVGCTDLKYSVRMFGDELGISPRDYR